MELSFIEILKAWGEAWSYFANFEMVLFMLGGMAVGLFIGILPGLGGPVSLGMFLIFVPFLTIQQALPWIGAHHAVVLTGGAVTTILLGVPGTSPNAATLLDGYTMSRKGEPGRALGLALAASTAGSFWSALLSLAMIPLVLPLIFAIASPEMIFVVLLGISLIATLSRGSTIKGVVSALLGMVVGLIGVHLVTGMDRFTFGSLYLRDGLPVIPVFLGIFAIPELATLASSVRGIASGGKALTGIKQTMVGVKEFSKYLRLNFISSAIGYLIGIIPGVGGIVASWVAYGQAKQTSKHGEEFGTGHPEGIVAPESSNNAAGGGSLLTTMALGIPGSEGCVLILGALVLLGITPGPQMLTEHLPLTINMLLLVAVAGLLAGVICLMAAPYLVKIVGVSGIILFPILIAFVVTGVFISEGWYLDVITLFIFGVIGLAMKQFGYNRPTFVLGFILGALFEKYLFISIAGWGPLFFLRPICIGLIVINIALMSFGTFTQLLKRGRPQKR